MSTQNPNNFQNQFTSDQIEVWAKVCGDYFPSDHSYGLYASLVNYNQNLRNCDWQLFTIRGHPAERGLIRLGSESYLGIRCLPSVVSEFINLETLTVGKWTIELADKHISQLSPSLNLHSRIVVIKNATTDNQMEKSLIAKAEEAGINATFAVEQRKILKIRRFTVVGFSVSAIAHSQKDSLLLQEKGIGGKRRMGGGVFSRDTL